MLYFSSIFGSNRICIKLKCNLQNVVFHSDIFSNESHIELKSFYRKLIKNNKGFLGLWNKLLVLKWTVYSYKIVPEGTEY